MRKAFQSFILGMAGILAIGCSSTPASAPKSGGGGAPTFSYPFFRTLGEFGSGTNGTFNAGPQGVAVSSSAIYVGDGNYSAVDKFDLFGNYLGQSYYGTGVDLGGMACDKNGNLYVSNYDNASVDEFDQNLNFIQSFTGGQFGTSQNFGGPYGVKVDGSNNLYVCDNSNEAIYKVDQTDTILATSSGTIPLSVPNDVALAPDGTIYVATAGYGFIVSLNSSLVSTGSFDGSNGGTAFTEPSGIAMDSQGNLVIVDSSNANVQSYTTAGVFLKSIGNTPSSVTFVQPWFLALDPSGNLLVTDRGNGFVAIFNP